MTDANRSQISLVIDKDIQALLEAGVSMAKLEELYGPKAVHRVTEAYILSADDTANNADNPAATREGHDRRSKLATLLYLRAPSLSTKSIMKSEQVIDNVFQALVDDPEPLLMDPLLHTPLNDPVVLSSGIVVDRSTALDPITGKLRLKICPFRRLPLTELVYEVYPLQERLREWEQERLRRCVSVAHSMMEAGDYKRAEQVFSIAHGFLAEHQQNMEDKRQMPQHASAGTHLNHDNLVEDNNNNNSSSNGLTWLVDWTASPTKRETVKAVQQSSSVPYNPSLRYQHCNREILLLALQLAQLERELPDVKDDIEKTVLIHQRIILVAQACGSDRQDVATLVIACLEDCWKRCSMLLAFAGKDASKKALSIRHAFSPMIKYTTLMQLELNEELQKLCHLDLMLAKHVEDESSIWNCRRVLLKLLPESEHPAFLEAEGISGKEEDLYYHLPYDVSVWPAKRFLDPSIGLVHFGAPSGDVKDEADTARKENDLLSTDTTQARGIACKVNLNPFYKNDHWVEVCFRPDNFQSPGWKNTIFSQHGEGTGWEIRCAVLARSNYLFWKEEYKKSGIFVEVVYTTTNGYNNVINSHVSLELARWYHVVLAYCHETSTISLYVNGTVTRQKIHGDFVPAPKSMPRLGENIYWTNRRFQGWVAFAGGGYELPVPGKDTPALDDHVQKLAKARLAKLPKQPAQHKSDVTKTAEGTTAIRERREQ